MTTPTDVPVTPSRRRRGRNRNLLLRCGLVALVALIPVACGSPDVGTTNGGSLDVPPTAPPQELPVTVTDAEGRRVTISDTSRIVPLFGDIAEIVFQLGLGDQVVGRDISATFTQARGLPVVTRAHDVSAESVLALHPSVVLADDQTGPPEALNHLRNVGVPVVVFERPASVHDIEDNIDAIATALGVAGQGRELAARTMTRVQEVAGTAPHPDEPLRVAFLYVRGQAGVSLMGGPGSGPDSLIETAGAVDAGTAIGLDRPFTPLTTESLVKAAPDVLLLTTTGLESAGGIEGLLKMPGIAQTPAGEDRRIVTIEDGLLFGFGSRTPVALRQLIDGLSAT